MPPKRKAETDSDFSEQQTAVADETAARPLSSSRRILESRRTLPLLTIASLGVVFGDIGTSPLYTFSGVFQDFYGNAVVPKPDDIKGGLCNIVWLITSVVCIKYIIVMMGSGSHHGEGGTFALLHNIKSSAGLSARPILWRFYQVVAAFAGALIVADGALTPVVTVTSAIEGIGLSVWRFNGNPGTTSLDNGQAGTPSNFGRTCTLSAAVLVLIFLLQSAGSQKVGTLYSPIVICWLLWIGSTGIQAIKANGGAVFEAWNPYHLRQFWTQGSFAGEAAWHSFGGIFLSVTGAEALFADQGHFGLPAIATAWFCLVYPMLLLCYTGQAAWLLSWGDLTDASNPSLCFSVDAASGAAKAGAGAPPYATYLSFPSQQPSCRGEGFIGVQGGSSGPNGIIANVFWWVAGGSFGSAQFKGILAIATLASIVGSQALLTGVATILSQAAELSLFPFFRIRHTSAQYEHQIYSPAVNAAMCCLCLFILGIFQHSSSLTAVYGACVATAMLMTTLLYAGVAIYKLKLPVAAAAAIVVPLLFMDCSLASANLGKFFVSGPVQLSYPSNTYKELQTASTLGRMGPVPQNAWVAMVPLIVATLLSVMMLAFLWGRRYVLLHSTKLAAFLLNGKSMELSTSLSTATAELGAMDEGLEPEIGATPVASETSEAANALSLNAYTVNAATMRKELDGLMSYNDGLMMALRYTRLERALAQLSAGGKLERSPGVGIYLASGASFYDTEPRPRPDDSYVFALPSAFLLAIRLGSLPAVSIILDVRFLHGDPFVPPDKRAELRHVRSIDAEAHHPDGIWHVIVRYGFAEQPGEGDLATLLARIGQEQAGLGGLTHIHCRPGRCCCSSSACVPVSIFVAREALCGGSMLDALPLGVYNALLHNTAGRAFFLNLPPEKVIELCVTVDIARLRGLRRKVASPDEPLPT